MKKSHWEIINITALVIILVVAFSISNLFNKSIKEENSLRNTQNANLTTTNEVELEVKEPEKTTYGSEQYTDLIVNDLASSEEEIHFSPKVAFIIDDLGYETEVAKKIMELEFPVALSILPFLRYSEFIAEEGKKNNQEIMLHLPMESTNSSTNPGPGAIKSYMSEEEIRQAVRDYVLNFPYIIGANNHMGSKITEDREIMEIVLEEIKKYNLFFIDSITTKDSIAYEVAQEMEIKSAVRSVFLDNENDMEYIKGQMLEVQETALREGEVIAIGHSRINTFYVLKRMVPELIKAGIEIVPVSELVK
ncbi:divergent polysaccharide deacetylase family protein [Candidatus Atribacteria bacterium MT.SAG.1]|nr:divergent polysaccharide deacetylase family protein [Candidatus Atribacteria bacterium MT.SAG.1]